MAFKKYVDVKRPYGFMCLTVIYMLHNLLENIKVVLASASPRRLELIKMMGVTPLVVPSLAPEQDNGKTPRLKALQNAQSKATSVAQNMDEDCLVVGADTLVVLDNMVLGKPKDNQQAAEYLRMLSGKDHLVYTGLCAIHHQRIYKTWEKSNVRFAPLSDDEIQSYLLTNEHIDKAGAYGIQGYGAQFISNIRGCYFNVMGFPIHKFYRLCLQILA